MGTSTSHPSPPTTGWRAVGKCYTSEEIPTSRVAAEIWRAALSRAEGLRQQIDSPSVFACLQIAATAPSSSDAFRPVGELQRTKSNSIVTEFAKPAALVYVHQGEGAKTLTRTFFRQL